MSESAIPQWKKELIARLRSQNRRTAQQLFSESAVSAVQQPVESGCERCEKMVQERSSDEEDLHYGPGIVSKLKERYLSLAQRDKPQRPTILRKAASLENLLDDAPEQRRFQVRESKAPSRYTKRGPGELKRARSVETISEQERDGKELKRESMHEEMLITGNAIIPEKPENGSFVRINRPKRLQPVMNEREKPPVDVVKQAKMIFERRPEQRTKPPQHTGEVAAKVATYKNIIVLNKPKKPAIKVKPVLDKPKKPVLDKPNKPVLDNPKPKKPVLDKSKPKTNGIITGPKSPENHLPLEILPPSPSNKKPPFIDPPPTPPPVPPRSPEKKFLPELPSPEKPPSLPSPIPDVSRIDFKAEETSKSTSLTETPDLIVTSSPLPMTSPSFKISATENFLKEEIKVSFLGGNVRPPPPPPTPTSTTFDFANAAPKAANHLPVNKNVLNTQTPPCQPLKLEINGVNETKERVVKPVAATLTTLEIEKNLINVAKTLEQPKNVTPSVLNKCEVTAVTVPKVKRHQPRELENNSIVFKFTDRKDVPDYVQNDGVTRVGKLEKPKVGEGGIILLPGASVGESFTDEDDEILRSLEGPPSPCDVTFINDNILIDGKSSLSQKTKRAKLKISFVNEGPEVYEYPSESSLLIEDTPKSPPVAKIRRSVPLTGGSTLANYTPKGTEDFLPGVTRSVLPISKPEPSDSDLFVEVERPILFSAGANTDMLF